jgi:flagellar motor switch protein FliN/FliY
MSDSTTANAAASHQAGSGHSSADSILNQAEAALREVEDSLRAPKLHQYRLDELIGTDGPPEKVSMDLLRDVTLDLKIELGRTRMNLDEILQLRKGSVVTLDKLAGDPVDIYVNGRLVARGEVLVLNDNFCVRVAELVGSDAIH